MTAQGQYVTIGVGEEIFAAPVTRVREILDMRPVVRLPRSRHNLLGMIDVRGAGVPVLDLRLTLGMPEAPDTENTRIVVLDVGFDGEPRPVGLRADTVFEVAVLDSATLEPPPTASDPAGERIIDGIGRRNGAFVTVLNLDQLLGSATSTPPDWN